MANDGDEESDVDDLEVIFANQEEQDGEKRKIVSFSNDLILFLLNQ